MDWMFSCGLLWCSNGIFLHEKKPKYSTSLLARQQILSRVNKLKVWTSSFVDSGLSSLCYQGPGSSLTALQVDVKHLNWFCMDWCPPLQPQQFPLFWEGLLQDFGMCLLEFLPIHPEEHEVRAFCGSVKFFHTKRIQPMPSWTMLCALVHSHAETERAFLKLFPQSWKHAIVQNVSVSWRILISLHSLQGFPCTVQPGR